MELQRFAVGAARLLQLASQGLDFVLLAGGDGQVLLQSFDAFDRRGHGGFCGLVRLLQFGKGQRRLLQLIVGREQPVLIAIGQAAAAEQFFGIGQQGGVIGRHDLRRRLLGWRRPRARAG